MYSVVENITCILPKTKKKKIACLFKQQNQLDVYQNITFQYWFQLVFLESNS